VAHEPLPVPTLDRHRLARVEADPHAGRERRICQRLLDEPLLKVDGGPQRIPRRLEGAQGFVAAQLDDLNSHGISASTTVPIPGGVVREKRPPSASTDRVDLAARAEAGVGPADPVVSDPDHR
jgi:hypothetical protein